LEPREILEALRDAKAPNRRLDIEIALLLGWTRTSAIVRGDDGRSSKSVSWFKPGEDTPSAVPFYTSSIDAAYELAQYLIPGHAAACTWSKEESTAVIDDGSPVIAADPAIALCIAILLEYFKRERLSSPASDG
jgi:hypothetical protein